MPCSAVKHVRLHRIAERRGERVLMVAKLGIELMECAFAQLRIPLHQKRAERTLAERSLAPGRVDEHAELHVYISELGKCVVVAAQRDIAEREETFLGH